MATKSSALELLYRFLHNHDKIGNREFQGQVGSLEDEIVLLKRAVLQGTSSTLEPIPTKVRVLKPKPFGGARNAKDLENFL
ncbi:hypothetical protein CK203_099556 [Vitis vinifera]|uniref:Uncharacterized protein n=1 Tax=Vitis vinifera TaxID=29760 RepID=A0A438CJ40_VITVI|nr:hypothetical protein CK203_099556 [Vitis vinifera]